MSTDRSERRAGTVPGSVALFIDWDNFAIGLRQEMPERAADVGPILRWARRFGVLTVCRAYGEWRDPQERLAIYNAGVEVVYAPVLPLGGSVVARSGLGGAKSLADTAMAVDVTEALSLMPTITSVILATSDKDLIPVLRFAQRRGLHAVVVGSDRTAGALRDLADEFISYRQLLEQEVPSGTQTRPAAVPPVRYPRAPRTAGALPAPAEPIRRGRFETRPPRPVITPVPPALESPAPAGETSTPGSVFADGEAGPPGETPAEAAARRRRRGGRRRRGREVTGAGQAEAATELAEDVAEATEEDAAEEAVPAEEAEATVHVAPGELAAEGPVAAQEAETPVVRRGPVVLPGERLRRLAGAAAEPVVTPQGAPGATAATGAPVAEEEISAAEPAEEAETEEEGEAEDKGAAGTAAARGRRRGGRGRATKTATKTAANGAAKKTSGAAAKSGQSRRATKRA